MLSRYHIETRRQMKESDMRNDAVLIVDDEEQQRVILKLLIETKGIPCLTAGTVNEACSVLKQEKVSIVLLDWRLNEAGAMRTGAEILKFCREVHPLMPIIVMTGLTPEEIDVRTDAVMAEADGFLQKPFSATVLTGHIERWLKRQRSVREWLLLHDESHILPLEELKRRYSRQVVALLDGNVSLAASKLGVHRHTLAALLMDFGSET
jgi:DNA-binding NtrC family response regulator